MAQSVGLSDAEIIKALAELEAFGEIMNVPGPQLVAILDRARKKMREKPSAPPGPPTPGPSTTIP